MGCDIHAVVENQVYGSWTSFAEVEIARDYKLFSAIAFGNGGITDDLPFPPRGLPSDHCNRVTWLFFVEADSLKDSEGQDDLDDIANVWGDWAVEQFVRHKIVPRTDWHTPSWLKLGELEIALNRPKDGRSIASVSCCYLIDANIVRNIRRRKCSTGILV